MSRGAKIATVFLIFILIGIGYFLFRPLEWEEPEEPEPVELPQREVEDFQLDLPEVRPGFGLVLEGKLLVESPDGEYMDLDFIEGELIGSGLEGVHSLKGNRGYLEMNPGYLYLEEDVFVKTPDYEMETGYMEWFEGKDLITGGGGVFYPERGDGTLRPGKWLSTEK